MRRVAFMALTLLLASGCGRARVQSAPAGPAACWGVVGTNPGQFLKPRALTASGGRLFVVDMSGRIQTFDLDGHWQAELTLAETAHGFPSGLATAPDGRIAVADTHNHRVLFYSPKGELLGSLGTEGGGPGEFTYVTDMGFDAAGNLYISEHGREDRIQKFDSAGRFVTAFGRCGEQPGEFHRPQALAVDADGTVYVADSANHRVQKFSPQGAFLASYGKAGRGPGEMLYPYGLALAPGKMLAVSEYGNNRIQIFDAEGRSAGILGKAGRAPGELCCPRGLAYVPGRGLYVADMDNHRVQRFELPAVAQVASMQP